MKMVHNLFQDHPLYKILPIFHHFASILPYSWPRVARLETPPLLSDVRIAIRPTYLPTYLGCGLKQTLCTARTRRAIHPQGGPAHVQCVAQPTTHITNHTLHTRFKTGSKAWLGFTTCIIHGMPSVLTPSEDEVVKRSAIPFQGDTEAHVAVEDEAARDLGPFPVSRDVTLQAVGAFPCFFFYSLAQLTAD